MPFECPQDVANDYESLLTNTNIVDYDVIIYLITIEKFMHTHLYYVQGLNIFVQNSLMDRLIGRMEILFLIYLILPLNYLI